MGEAELVFVLDFVQVPAMYMPYVFINICICICMC